MPSFRGSSEPREDCSHFYISLAPSVHFCSPQLFRFSCCVSATFQTNASCKLLIPIKNFRIVLYSVQFSCVRLFATFCNPMDCSAPGLPVHHQLLEPTQTHIIDFRYSSGAYRYGGVKLTDRIICLNAHGHCRKAKNDRSLTNITEFCSRRH